MPLSSWILILLCGASGLLGYPGRGVDHGDGGHYLVSRVAGEVWKADSLRVEAGSGTPSLTELRAWGGPPGSRMVVLLILHRDESSQPGRVLHLQLFADGGDACETTHADARVTHWGEERVRGTFSFTALCPGDEQEVTMTDGAFAARLGSAGGGTPR